MDADVVKYFLGQSIAVVVLGIIAYQLWQRLKVVEDRAREDAANYAKLTAERANTLDKAIEHLRTAR